MKLKNYKDWEKPIEKTLRRIESYGPWKEKSFNNSLKLLKNKLNKLLFNIEPIVKPISFEDKLYKNLSRIYNLLGYATFRAPGEMYHIMECVPKTLKKLNVDRFFEEGDLDMIFLITMHGKLSREQGQKFFDRAIKERRSDIISLATTGFYSIDKERRSQVIDFAISNNDLELIQDIKECDLICADGDYFQFSEAQLLDITKLSK